VIWTSVRLTLRLHRFEVGAAVLAAVVLGVVAFVIKLRLDGVAVPTGCFDTWLTVGPDQAGACSNPVSEFARINEEEAGKLFAAMAILPFAAGLVTGIPIVARELESRTAQTAWSLAPSRAVWLALQFVPIVFVMGLAVAFAALASSALESTRLPWIRSPFPDLMLHGGPLLARAVLAASIGLLVGALVGRQLPALIIGALVIVLLTIPAARLEGEWLRSQQRVVNVGNQEPALPTGATMVEPAWLGPNGDVVRVGESLNGIQAPLPGGLDGIPAGWQAVTIGVDAAKASSLALLDSVIFLFSGLVAAVGSFFVVNGRRPT
jgi:hypothetical protein